MNQFHYVLISYVQKGMVNREKNAMLRIIGRKRHRDLQRP